MLTVLGKLLRKKSLFLNLKRYLSSIYKYSKYILGLSDRSDRLYPIKVKPFKPIGSNFCRNLHENENLKKCHSLLFLKMRQF